MLAFRAALAAGADGLECDVQQTADGQLVLIHDRDLSRLTGLPGLVDRLPLDQLATRRVQGEAIPTLGDLLAWMPRSRVLNIELKADTISRAAARRVADQVALARGIRTTVFSSFRHDLLKPCAERGFRIALLAGRRDAGGRQILFLLRGLRMGAAALNPPVGPLEAAAGTPWGPISRGWLLLLKWAGVRMLFWTINTRRQYRLVRRVAWGVIGDEVDLLVDRSRSQRRRRMPATRTLSSP